MTERVTRPIPSRKIIALTFAVSVIFTTAGVVNGVPPLARLLLECCAGFGWFTSGMLLFARIERAGCEALPSGEKQPQ